MIPLVDRAKMRANLLNPLLEKARLLTNRLVKRPSFFFNPQAVELWKFNQLQTAFTIYTRLKSYGYSMDNLGAYLDEVRSKLQVDTVRPKREHKTADVLAAPTRDTRLTARRKESRLKRLRGSK